MTGTLCSEQDSVQQGGIKICMKCNAFSGVQQQFSLGAEGTWGLQYPSALGISALPLMPKTASAPCRTCCLDNAPRISVSVF